MTDRKGITVATVVMLISAISFLLPLDFGQVAAQHQAKQAANKSKTIPRSSRIREVIKGSERPNEIPDIVAYELFLRTVAHGNARGLVKQVGLSDEQTEAVLKNALSLYSDFIEPLDRRAYQLKTSQEFQNAPSLRSELNDLQDRKDFAVSRVVNQFLPSTLRKAANEKLADFISRRVKTGIQKIQTTSTGTTDLRGKNFLINSFDASNALFTGQLYLYSAGWQDGPNVFGSGSLSEQYGSSVSYKVTVTVSSPTGRQNVTGSDWNFATLTHDSGLSVGVEDGTYTVSSSFEEQTGTYDEYGNFTGTGSSYVGSSNSSTLVAPSITVTTSLVTPSRFFIGGNPPGGQGTGVVSARLIATQSVPPGTTVEYDFVETENGTSPQNRVGYSVTAGTPTGYMPYPMGNRQLRRAIAASGEIVTEDNMFTITLSGQSANTGSVINQVRINRIIATPSGSPANGGVAGENSMASASFTLTPAPTPTPTPGGGGGGCDLFRNGDINTKDVKEVESARCTPCSPTVEELNACQSTGFGGGGGTYDWEGCFCGQSPVVLDILGNGYDLTNLANGIFFDIRGSGMRNRISWTAATSDDAWLVLDRNQNNQIDDGTEMFGNNSEQPAGQDPKQGFATLGLFDTPARGGNGDGKITRSDAVFRKLRLWVDRNHNGISEPEELSRLPALDVVALDLDYRESKRTDVHGNKFKYRAKVRDRLNARVGRWAWDVFLITGN